tara:strand:+ start:442 stop:543 length:102 start_codon:yes stop_codon:yes gene_type:complete
MIIIVGIEFDNCPDKKCGELLIIEDYYSGSEGD